MTADTAPTTVSSELLGFAPDTRVLLVNCDDFGMYHAVNSAVIASIEGGIAVSCSLMVPCPWALHGMRLLRERPEIPFGIHLTLVCDTTDYRWGPLSARDRVPSLLDDAGELFTPAGIPELLGRARPEEVEREFRAQIDAVVDTGLRPTHLDWHCLADGGREDILDLTVALAGEYGLAVRIWLPPAREKMLRRGRPVTDHAFLDSFALDLDGKADRWAGMLRSLPAGLSEWAVHPGLDDAESRAIDGGWRVRSTDHAFLTSPEALAIVRQEGIVLTDYRRVQQVWAAAGR
ncbi:polysaccharide deacetylase family protein [Streptomyces clavifer]|uniref:polysaccharide deacetylase family protein n=1 Tax=Streptomyces clavifer TaxID=68188 RepID=UPI003799C124